MNKVSSFFMVIGLTATLHVNAQGGGFNGNSFHGGGMMMQGQPPMGPPPAMNGERPMHGEGPMPGMMPDRRNDMKTTTVMNDFCINSGTVVLRDVSLSLPNNELMRVRRDKRRKLDGEGHLQLSTDSHHTYWGNVYADKRSTVSVSVDPNVTWEGALNPNKRCRKVTAVINGTWNMTQDSYIDRLVIGKDAVINTNGHKLKYHSLDNQGMIN